MSFLYAYVGGCAVVGGVVFATSKAWSYVYGTPPESASRSNTEQLEGSEMSESEKAMRLREQLLQLQESLASLKSRYKEKYGEKPTDRTVTDESLAKSSTSRKRAKKSSKTSGSSSGSSKVETVVARNQKSHTGTFTVDSSSTYRDAENCRPSLGFSGSTESGSKCPVVGESEVKPLEKVEKWLETNSAGQTDVPLAAHGKTNYPKAIAMTIPLHDHPPKRCSAGDRDPFDACETYMVSTPRRESPKKNAPHLYKRLSLRKKSTPSLNGGKFSRDRSRKSGDEVLGSNKDTEITNKSETELRQKKEDTDFDPSPNHTLLVDSSESSDECEENTAGKFLSRSETPLQTSFPRAAENRVSAESASKSSSAKPKFSQTRLKQKIDEVLGSNPKTFEQRKSRNQLVSEDQVAWIDSPAAGREVGGVRLESELREEKRDAEFSESRLRKEAVKPETNKEARGKARSKERPKTADHGALFTARRVKERAKERAKSAEKESTNAFAKRKEFQTKCQLKTRTGSNNGAKVDEKETKTNPFARRKEFGSKFHMKDGREHHEEVEVVSPRKSPFEKRKEFQLKYQMKEHIANDSPRLEQERDVKSNQFVKRKQFGSKFQMKDVKDIQEDDVVPPKKSPFEKRKEFQMKYQMRGSGPVLPSQSADSLTMQTRADKRKIALSQFEKKYVPGRTDSKCPVAGETSQGETCVKTEKASPLRRRLEYDAECRRKASGLFKRKSATERNSNPDLSARQDLNGLSPSMNRNPNDGTRKTYLFDWESKSYAVADEPEVVIGSRPRGSSNPAPKGKSLPAPRAMKRPLSAGVCTRAKDMPRSKKAVVTDTEANSSEGELSLREKTSSDWGSQLSTNTLDFEFDPKGLSESTLASAVSEETMVKELQDKVLARRGSDLEGRKAIDGQFLVPRNVLGLRRSDEELDSDEEEDDPTKHVFTGSTALRKSKKSLFTKESCEQISVQTKGYRRIALEET